MQDKTKKWLQNYESRRAAVNSSAIEDEELAQLWSYRQAAALLHCFYPDKLMPLDERYTHPKPRVLLYDDIFYTPGSFSEGLFTLETNIRNESLKRFSSREAMLKGLAKNPDRPVTTLQSMWEEYLKSGTLPNPDSLSYSALTEISQVISWLTGIEKNIPDSTYIEKLLRKKAVLTNFEHLVATNFVGRRTELGLLRKHVEPSATRPFKAITDIVASWAGAIPSPIVSVFGPGGIGKSALAGRLLWENMQGSETLRFPFAYLPFDRGILRIESPFTILVEAASQFNQQFPEYGKEIQEFNDNVRKFRDSRGALLTRKTSMESRNVRIQQYNADDAELFKNFSRLINVLGKPLKVEGPARCILLVFDTFEEVQYRDYENLNSFWRMLYFLVDECPLLRIIITGRTSILNLGVDKKYISELTLEELGPADRSLLLQQLGVDAKLAPVIAAQVGGSPLSLRLAANVVLSDKSEADSKGIKGLNTRKWLFFQLDEKLIQGQLYKRILDHIHDENVRKLAHPGMVLRCVNPDVILNVLAPHCEISITSLEEARLLFEKLKKEAALVQIDHKGDLLYRPEIRRSMIRLMQHDKFNQVRKLHKAAIDYYTGRPDLSDRAEELYHRLALGEDDYSVLDNRWTSGIETSIASNLDEYSDRMKVFLASRISLEIPREIFQSADIADWERNTTRKVKKLLAEFAPVQALEFLGERDRRTDASPLFALEAKAHIQLENYKEADSILDKGIDQVAKSANRGRLAELFWLQSQVQLHENQIQDADDSLRQAGEAVVNAADPLPYIHILCHRLLIRSAYKQTFTETAGELRVNLNRICEQLDVEYVHKMNFVLPMALEVLGEEFPKTRERLKPYISNKYALSKDMLTTENLQGIDEYREEWEDEDNLSVQNLV